MPASTWLDQVLAALCNNGIPERHRRRFLAELQDHLTDLQEARMNGTEPLDLDHAMGPPEPLGQALADSFRRKRFLTRHPWLAWLAFSLGPLVIHGMLTMFLTFLTLAILVCFPGSGLMQHPERMDVTVSLLLEILGSLTAVAVTIWFCLAARRNRLTWRLSLLSCFTVMGGTLLLVLGMSEAGAHLWPGTLLPGAVVALAAWYWAAWRGQRWQEKPISLSRRTPVLLTGIVSVGTASFCLGGYLLLAAGVVAVLRETPRLPYCQDLLKLIGESCRIVPFALAAYLCWRLTHRCPRRVLTSLAACMMVTLFAVVLFANLATTPEGESSIQLGVTLMMKPSWKVLGQVAPPPLIWAFMMVLRRHQVRAHMPVAA